MFSELILTIVSTTIVGGIVFIIFNLISNSNFGDEEQQESDKSVTNEFVDIRTQEKEECLAHTQNEAKPDHSVSEEVAKSDQPLNSGSVSGFEKLSELSSVSSLENESLINKTVDNENSGQIDDNDGSEDLLDFEEIIKEAEESTYERPVKHEVVNEVVVKDVSKTYENEFKAQSEPNSQNQVKENQMGIDVNEQPFERHDIGDNDLENEFWNIEDSQNLKHLNKSRPKKHKSRPSVKVVFTDESTGDKSDQQIAEDPVTKNARELVDNLFETLDSDVEEYKNRTDSAENSLKGEDMSEEQKVFESESCETNETTISKNDDTFEEIASGEYKKFDEFSDHFRTETRKHEISRKVYEISSVKNFEITTDSSEPLNEEMFDNLLKNFEAIDSKTEVFEENYRKVTESETIQVRKGDQTTEVVPIRNNESVFHTKSISERSLSSSSLSKMSLEDLNLNLKSSKSRLSETIDSVTKPLLSSPTLFRRSMISSDEELGAENDGNESSNRIQLPLFGRTQSMLMKEMKEKDFRKSLKPFNDLKFSDKNISNE